MKPDLILLHGALGSARQYETVIPLLQDNFTVHCPDLPGHGNLAHENTPADIRSYTGWLQDYLRSFSSPPALAAYSMGGYIALSVAAVHSELIRNLFAFSVKMNWSAEYAEQEAGRLQPDIMKEKIPAYTEYLETLHGQEWKKIVSATAGILRSIGKDPLQAASLQRITCPVTMAIGTEDRMVSWEETAQTVYAIKGAVYHPLEGQPHPLERINPELLAQAINASVQI